MLARFTWQPDDTDGPETITVDLPTERIEEMRQLIGTPAWANSEAATWIPCRTGPGAPVKKWLFRLARITAITPIDPTP
ncbi:hypothetical protein QMK19_03360 [Streptomyces sp. H10-C2]|uniref:hypothetical protein n=1 Tax=unclassified Streptomyces TaxID=2593676 RepID=UPI0024BBD51C|nr:MULTISPECIES: hypothetical protein [unclassified Streptomyces]MDJ0342224.1 hypothetical protein [Streptomyces sp. PH10-H1]MDJ0368738.1 hypothetical protein [Streptomyces sp. H10-C2]